MAFHQPNALGHIIPHDVLCMFEVDQQQIRSTMADYVAHEDTMRDVDVPGDSWQCTVVSDGVTNTTKALVYWLIRLHLHNFSLNGQLILNGFCVDLCGLLKGTLELYDLLVPLNAAADNRDNDLIGLANFAEAHLYQPQNFVGAVPEEVGHFLNLLNNYPHPPAGGNFSYLLIKSHPALADAIGKSSLFVNLYGRLQSLMTRNVVQYTNVINHMNHHAAINTPQWICDSLRNVFLHEIMCFTSKPRGLFSTICYMLTNSITCCGQGELEACLRVRRNAESHLLQDYCAEGAGADMGIEQAIRAAIAAATHIIPTLAMAPPYPPYPADFIALQPDLRGVFQWDEAAAIATAIRRAIRTYAYSTIEADAAATAAAGFLGNLGAQGLICTSNPSRRLTLQQRRVFMQKYHTQQTQAARAAAQAAAQGVQAQALVPRNMFTEADVSNIFTLMAPRLLCTLHHAMFHVGELQALEWHWNFEEVYLA